jgi:class 3 adenylate cyclase/tetratricopeptide (TPR) repeat protein
MGGAIAAGPPPAIRLEPEPLTYIPSHLAEKILTSRVALAGERKQVTVLFADLKASMELLADRDPEEARQILDPVLERMIAAVHRYEGTVNQIMGDGIMALFGAPIAHEDHAIRACYAALAMQAALRRYSDEVRRTHGLAVHFRVGLNSGEVVVRAIGNDLHMDYSAIGQTVHLAARMEQLATPGSILLTPATLRLVEGLVRVHALGAIPVKGLAEPVEVYELVGASALRQPLQAAVGRGLTHFVGRQHELDALHQALEHAGSGHGQVVAVVGEAGVGKSRLAYEFVHAHQTQGWLVLESTSVPYGKSTPYFPVVDLLKRYVRVEDADDPRAIQAKVTGHLLTLDQTLQDTIPAVLALLDVLPGDHPFLQLDPPQRRRSTFDALKRVLLRESRAQPLLLVFEDLHWINAETQALLDSLVESLPTARLLLLVNYRPEYQHGWGSKTYYTQLRLDPLPLAGADALLHALLGDDAGARHAVPLLTARTEGNPFFLEESVRTLVETGVLVGEPGNYRLAPHVGAAPCGHPEVGNHRGLPRPIDIQIPATVQAVLAARIDRLPSEEKRLLQTAAVIGTEVPLPLLQAIAELPEAAPQHGLANQYLGFTYHDQGDYRRAIDCFKQTVAFFDGAGHHERFGQVWLPAMSSRANLAVCHAELGTFAESRTLGEEGLRIAEAVDHPASVMMASWGVGLLALRQGDLSRALPRLERAMSICQDADLPAPFPRIAAALGAVYTLAGRVGDAVLLLTQALEQAMATEMGGFQALCGLSLGQAQLLAGHLEEGQALAERTLELARAHQERGHEAYALRLLGDIAVQREPPERDQAEAYYRQALVLTEELGMRPLQAHCHHSLGKLYATIGRRAEARAELSLAIDLYSAMDMAFWLPQAEAALAQLKER